MALNFQRKGHVKVDLPLSISHYRDLGCLLPFSPKFYLQGFEHVRCKVESVALVFTSIWQCFKLILILV